MCEKYFKVLGMSMTARVLSRETHYCLEVDRRACKGEGVDITLQGYSERSELLSHHGEHLAKSAKQVSDNHK